MPYFGRITLAPGAGRRRRAGGPLGGRPRSTALDRLDPAEGAGRRVRRPGGPGPAVVRAGDRLVGRPAGRGARACPRPRRPAPRHQAVERAGHRRRHADAPRLQPGARAARPRTARPATGHAGRDGRLHGARTPRGPRRRRRPRGSTAGPTSTAWASCSSRPLTGRRPFAAPRRGSSIVEALHPGRRRAAAARRPGCAIDTRDPAGARAVIRRCLEPDPADRYRSAAELAADLQAVADDLPLAHAREPLPAGRSAG